MCTKGSHGIGNYTTVQQTSVEVEYDVERLEWISITNLVARGMHLAPSVTILQHQAHETPTTCVQFSRYGVQHGGSRFQQGFHS